MLLANKSPGASFSCSVFIFTLGTPSKDESIVGACDSHGIEARAVSAPPLLPGINKVRASSYCPQRILTGPRCLQAESMREGRCWDFEVNTK